MKDPTPIYLHPAQAASIKKQLGEEYYNRLNVVIVKPLPKEKKK